MKKLTINCIAAYVALFLLAFLFKLMHWPGADMLVVADAVLALVLVLPLCLYMLIAKPLAMSTKFMLLGIALSSVGISGGCLLKVEHLLGANLALIIGILAAVFMVIPGAYGSLVSLSHQEPDQQLKES